MNEEEPEIFGLVPHECDHEWKPVSLAMADRGFGPKPCPMPNPFGGNPSNPSLFPTRVYLVCLECSSWTYQELTDIGYQLYGAGARGYHYKQNSSHKFSIDGGETWICELPNEFTDELQDASAEEIAEAQDLVESHWRQVSSKFRMVAQLPEDVRAAMLERVGRRRMREHWDDAPDRDVTDQYLRVHAESRQLTPAVFRLFKLLGGRTSN